MATKLASLLTLLDREGIRFVIIGPVAAQAHGVRLPAGKKDTPVDLVPDDRRANLDKLAHVLGSDLAARLRLTPEGATLPLVLNAGTFTRVPTLPLSTALGPVNVLLSPTPARSSYASVAVDASAVEVEGVSVQVATTEALLDGLAGGAGPADDAVLGELRRVRAAERIESLGLQDAKPAELLPAEERHALELALRGLLAHRGTAATVRDIVTALGGRQQAPPYPVVRSVADDLVERGILLRDRVGTANTYRLNDDYESRVTREIADLLGATRDPAAAAQRALELLAEDSPEPNA